MGYREEMDSLNFLQKEVKRKGMMYQIMLKEDKAKLFGLPLWAFYHVSWSALPTITASKAAAIRWWKKNRLDAAKSEAESLTWTHATKEKPERFYDLVLEDLKKKAKIKD